MKKIIIAILLFILAVMIWNNYHIGWNGILETTEGLIVFILTITSIVLVADGISEQLTIN